MRATLDVLAIGGRVVFGSLDDSGGLTPGAIVGSGGKEVDLALDPLEGRGVVARGGNGAMSMIAVGDPGRFTTLPDIYMRKMAVGPRARGSIDLLRPVGENIEAIAEAFGRRVNDVTTIVLDRPRHHDLIEEIRSSGARIKLIQDGDVTASISAAIRGTNDHLAIGIGGTRQAVLSAAALRCLGGELQAQFWPTSRSEIDELREAGIEDYERVFRTEDLAPGEVIVAATGRLERRPASRRPLPRRQRAHPFAPHVHALQLGALRRRHPFLRARATRRGPSARLLAISQHETLFTSARARRRIRPQTNSGEGKMAVSAEGLASAVKGRVVEAGAPDYDESRALYNAMIDKRPAAIAYCVDEGDVVAALRYGVEHGLRIAIRGGGHNGGGLGSVDDGLVIDLSQITRWRSTPARRLRAWEAAPC